MPDLVPRLRPWLGAVACGLPLLAAAAPTAAPEAFILRLRDAPAHTELSPPQDRRQASVATRSQALRLAQRRQWQAVLSGSGLDAETGWRLEPVGRASWRLVPGHRLSATEARRWQAALAAQPGLAWVEPDRRESRLQALPDDPLYSEQWWLHPAGGANANAASERRRGAPGFQTAWARLGAGSGPVVAVLDTGLTPHPDIDASRVLPGFDMVSDWDSSVARGLAADGNGRDSDPTDPGDAVTDSERSADPTRYAGCSSSASSWHGTAVAGLLAGHSRDASGGAGAYDGLRLLPVRVSGQCGASLRDIVDGLRWSAGLTVCQRWADAQDPGSGCAEWAPTNPYPAKVVNLSFGAQVDCGSEYQAAIDELWARGVLVVAPAGNAHGAPARPANCRHVVGVAALNRDGFKASYSNFGSALAIATVGGDDNQGLWGALLADPGLLGPTNEGLDRAANPGWGTHYGSSFAAPLVSATLAMMLAADPQLSAAQLVDGLGRSARPHVRSTLIGACSVDNPGRCLCSTANCGAGILDADQALAWAQAQAAGSSWQAPNWPTEWLDTDELRQAVALGPDREPTATTGNGSGSGSGSPAGGGGGGSTPWSALGLLGAALALRRRR
ncbi:S8 family serine peptidase [Ideonella sp. 4Y11]|uniref:S8 family serine peptidase n=1 Tax=Ideonella aquatica TaxID=2824119 RepID=A0A941BS62_9BURK|nr:S8 family serine peptidase [Ideonella aquatica]MBQ0961260.1 S8 family serine peptidase [Ideonella aquatica]